MRSSDDDEKYWREFEKTYVHDVYESMSPRYDEFVRLQCLQSRKRAVSSCCGKPTQTQTQGGVSSSASHQQRKTPTATDGASTAKVLMAAVSPHRPSGGKRHSRRDKHLHQAHAHQRQASESGGGGEAIGPSEANHIDAATWPKVKQFLLGLDRFSLVADIGCGDGKYLSVNASAFVLGCDRSSSLLKLAADKSSPSHLVVADNLSLPLRTATCDAVISIGVLHHISTHARRARALAELARLLLPGGKLMIYVWAMEQQKRVVRV